MGTTVIQNAKNSRHLMLLHFTDLDLNINSRKKSFEEITLRDLDYCLNDVMEASMVFYIDNRHRRAWWKRILGMESITGDKVKQLK